jgi:multiple sugar transport system substrate-binding protein
MKKHSLKARRGLGLLATAALVLTAAGCAPAAEDITETATDTGDGTTTQAEVVLEFAQWWEPELPEGSFRALMDEFESQNPGIKVELLSGPYSTTKEQLFAGAASGTMADVVGLDGAWVNDFAKTGSLADMTKLMEATSYDQGQLASQIQIQGSTYMIPIVNFVYPLYTNDDLLASAGVTSPPTNRTEFRAAAKAVSGAGVHGWALPLSLEAPNGIQNDVMSWVWASGGSMLKDGQPDVTNSDVSDAVEFIKNIWDDGSIAPGSFTMKEQDKLEEFTNGRAAMIVSSLSHINVIRDSNPELNFSVSAMPAVDGYTGKRGIPYASWGIGVAENSEHKAEAWKLISFLMSESTNAKLSSIANAFPGNTTASPDFVQGDELFGEAFEIYQSGFPANEFVGLPVAEQLMRLFDEQFQLYLDDDISLNDMLKVAQESWVDKF